MKKQILLGSILIYISIAFFSCNDNNAGDSDKEYPKTASWAITQVLAAVELENQTVLDDELVAQIAEELKSRVRPLWTSYNFTYDEESNYEGQLIISFQESDKKITAGFIFETNDDNTSLSIKYNDGKEEIYRILTEYNYMIADYTQEYKLLNPRVLRAEGIEKFTIPR